MLMCSCIVNTSSRKVAHKWDCNFLKNKLESFCCDEYMGSSNLVNPFHDTKCINWMTTNTGMAGKKPKAMWARLMVFEGEKEWVDTTIRQSLYNEGHTQVGRTNSITSTTVCYRDTSLGE